MEYKCGSGVTAEVYHGIWRGTAVAVKQIKLGGKRTSKLLRAFKRELAIMVRCRHPNLVLFMGAVTVEEPIKVVFEFCEGGNLFDLLHNGDDDIELSLPQKLKILLDIAKGLTYLHASNIVHRDLKSLNLLLTERIEDEHDKPIIKIADFGMAKIKQQDQDDMTANAGTYHWMAPEVLNGNQRYHPDKVKTTTPNDDIKSTTTTTTTSSITAMNKEKKENNTIHSNADKKKQKDDDDVTATTSQQQEQQKLRQEEQRQQQHALFGNLNGDHNGDIEGPYIDVTIPLQCTVDTHKVVVMEVVTMMALQY
ncbi:protein kinase, putative [Perkinsus marinus ATCC 50983]|uniref:Protein kinase, putative n=1 Tax=Perkinsus marinus (strain ATCC 50983 / TXsc) TaxID=423536 RepID=C5K8M9_PERM5|nr:protein kinase, putative [Perkinsus marinus ATCC 50983]EER19236.1 protein kinase, putative [Perkinsus marinus ATCC 50983]|eukprot:XP_002787440.1 protein kinase, putative [Perkinsus marinus ATCC 50983]